MSRQGRVLAIGLDGYEHSLGEKLMQAGELPCLAALRNKSARFLLEHGPGGRTGLAWEHVSTGRSPEAADRWSAVDFDTNTYAVWHSGTSLPPFPAALQARTVVFDAPYFDLHQAPTVRGVMNWGAHDPGVAIGARPGELVDELHSRFGLYPARDVMYDVVWPSTERTRTMGNALVQSAEVRARAARWLFQERCPDWNLALVVAGEIHSAIENFWHGVDPGHPLHDLPSASQAGSQLRAVYRATDALVGELMSAFPDATVVVFAMNGMGPNLSDVASMVLLSELLYRQNFGRPLLRVPRRWADAPRGLPMTDAEMPWSQAVNTFIQQFPAPLDMMRRLAAQTLPEGLKKLLRPNHTHEAPASKDRVLRLPLDWMPTELYQRHWRTMRYFALPSFYDGRVRINLAGRERNGLVSPGDYESVCDELESLVRACRDTRTGEPVVDRVERCGGSNPLEIGPSECDLVFVWGSAALGLDHPAHGRIGPVPYRRTGGHTGPYGMAFICGSGMAAGEYGVRSSYDVVPTIVELLGEPLPPQLSGCSLLALTKDHSSVSDPPPRQK